MSDSIDVVMGAIFFHQLYIGGSTWILVVMAGVGIVKGFLQTR